MGVRVGMRLRCERCGSEAIITAAGEAELEGIRAALADEIERAIAQAESEPDPRPEDAAKHVYTEGAPLPDGTRA